MPGFKEFGLSPEVQEVLDDIGFTIPTEIQKKAIPILLSSKKIDFHGQAQTGTGKTLAFGIPLIERIEIDKKYPQVLIVAPTRELAVQIHESIAAVSKKLPIKFALIYGGMSFENQVRLLRSGAQIIIGTPGRLNDHINKKTLILDKVKTLVLDEADIMLDMGFKDDIDHILRHVPSNREIWLFSATVKSGITDIMKSHMEEPVSVRVSQKQIGTISTEQFYCIMPFRSRLHALNRFIQANDNFYGFIFCQTKILASEVADQLIRRGFNVAALHGDMAQAQRNIVIKKFKAKEFTILVATDVAARGIDVANLTHVINYSIPEDLESYVHRVGRTGRAGKLGTAITFISKSELRTISFIEKRFGIKILPIEVPTIENIINNKVLEISHYLDNIKKLDVPNYLKIQDLVKKLPEGNQEIALGNLLYEKFLLKLDLHDIAVVHADNQAEQLQEIYLSLGLDDGINRDDIESFLLHTGLLKVDQIKTIRVIKHRSFAKLAADCTPDLLNSLRGKLLKGKPVRVNLTCLVDTQRSFDTRSQSRRYKK